MTIKKAAKEFKEVCRIERIKRKASNGNNETSHEKDLSSIQRAEDLDPSVLVSSSM